MKRIFIIAALAALALTACGGGKDVPPVETARSLIGEDAKALYEAIGEPEKAAYASSCIGEGEDGELQYDGFTVYTYRDTDGSEAVQDVLETS